MLQPASRSQSIEDLAEADRVKADVADVARAAAAYEERHRLEYSTFGGGASGASAASSSITSGDARTASRAHTWAAGVNATESDSVETAAGSSVIGGGSGRRVYGGESGALTKCEWGVWAMVVATT